MNESRNKLKPCTIGLIISLCLMLCLSLVNWSIVSDSGNVKIKRLYLSGNDGLNYSALSYVPSNATDNTPAPAILMVHGAAGNARNHESWAVEFSRRGFVVISIDWNGAGESDNYSKNNRPEGWNGEQTQPEYWLKYLLSLPYVDANKVIISGHSMGCPSAANLAEKYQLRGSILASGARAGTLNFKGEYNGAVLLTTGQADLQDNTQTIGFHSKTAQIMGFINEGEEIEYGKLYGNYRGKCFLGLRIPDQVHEFAFASKDAIGAFVDFAQNIIDAPNYIDSTDQVWFRKDVIGQLGMYSFAATLVFLYLCLVENLPVFGSIKQPRPRNIGVRKIGMLIAIIVTIGAPILCMKTATFGLLTTLQNSGLFNMGHPTKPLTVVIGTTIFGIIMLIVFWMTDGKKHNINMYDLGVGSYDTGRIKWSNVLKSFLLAIIVISIGWSYLSLQTKILGTDFYCLFWGFKPIPWNKFTQYIPYIVMWTLCFIITSIGINVEKRLPDTGKEWLDTLIAIVFNVAISTISVIFIVWLQNKIQLDAQGELNGQAMVSWAIDITRLYGMPAGMSIGIASNTYLYRKTGSIWPGTFLTGIMCSLGAVLYGTYSI